MHPTLRRILLAVDTGIYVLCLVIATVAVLGFMVHVGLDVGFRYFTGRALRGTIDFVQYWYMLVIVFLGFVVALRQHEHIDIDMVVERLPRDVAKALQPIAFVAMAGFVGLIAWYGLNGAFADMEIGRRGSASRVPLWPVRFVIPVGATLLFLQLITNTARNRTDRP